MSNLLNPKEPLKILADKIDWQGIELTFEPLYNAPKGQPPKPIRLMIGLLMLEHIYALSDRKDDVG